MGVIFETQAALKRHIRDTINRAQLDAPLHEQDADFLIDILRRHQHWDAKQGPGIKSGRVRMNPPPGFGHAQRGIWLIRTDDSEVGISWYAPLEQGGDRYAARGVSLAARCEISDQTRAVYDRYRGTPCPICKAPLFDAHVDHTPPLTLARLLENWLCAEGLTHADIKIADAGTKNLFTDRTLGARWVEYHRLNAKLRLIHPGENLRQAK